MSENKTESPALFEDRSMQIAAQGDAAAVARATQEIQAALVVAQRFKRDEIAAEARILQACKRKGLAAVAEYEYSRGGSKITGPTIDLLRAIANRWGNLLFGWSEVERSNGQSMVRCWAWDTQNNSRAERTFVVRHWRDTQAGGYAIEDERDIYELLANMASRRVRACLEEVIDADIVEKAVDQCRKTMREGHSEPLKDRVARMLLEFNGQFGVTQEMIEQRLGNKLDAVSENQLASLRRVFTALRDGVGKREDYFKQSAPVEPPKFAGETEQAPPPPPAGPLVTPAPAQAPAEAPSASEPPAGGPPPPQAGSNLRLLRDMCRVSKIKEGELLNALAEIGVTDGSCGTLEELQLSNANIIAAILKDWSNLAEKIKATRPKK